MNKPVLIVAMLALVLMVSVPALTQTAPTNDIEASPVQETGATQYAEDASVDPAAAPVPATATEPAPASTPDAAPAPAPGGATVGCGVMYNDPTATCALDADGFITLPDGSTAPVLVRPDGIAYIQDASGGLILIGEGASFITGADPAEGATQEAAAQEQPSAAEPVAEEPAAVEPVAEETAVPAV